MLKRHLKFIIHAFIRVTTPSNFSYDAVLGTGFMGKVFIEKLLRVTEVAKIFMIIRHKKNVNPKDRLLKMFENPVSHTQLTSYKKYNAFFNNAQLFDKLKMQMSIEKIMERIVIINGDCSLIKLGMSDDDREMITSNVSLIYHFCASIRFDEVYSSFILFDRRRIIL